MTQVDSSDSTMEKECPSYLDEEAHDCYFAPSKLVEDEHT
jgi:phage terminase small subunit